MTAIIFGASGQDGTYLTQLLQKQGIMVIGISRSEGFMHSDITNFDDVKKLVQQHQPDYIFHLAANSTTHHSALFDNHQLIATGTVNILEAIKDHSPHTKLFLSGSGLQFKNEGKPIHENCPFEARDAYSASRIYSVYMARYYRSLGIKVYVGYFFNHDSELRTERHMTQKIAMSVKRIANGSKEKLEIGCVDTIKEYTHAADVVEAIWALVKQDKIFEVVIGSGKGYTIEAWLQLCFSAPGLNWKNFVVIKNDFVPAYNSLISDPALIKSLGWEPKIEFEELGKRMMQ